VLEKNEEYPGEAILRKTCEELGKQIIIIRYLRNMRQENKKMWQGLKKMQIRAIKCGKFEQKMRHTCIIRNNTSVKAIGKHKHIIFRHPSTAVCSR